MLNPMKNLLYIIFFLAFLPVATAQIQVGDSLMGIGDYKNAIIAYSNVESSAAIQFKIAQSYTATGNYAKAIEAYEKGIKADGDVFRLLPQTLYTDFGEFQYNFDFTTGDATIFLDGPATTDFSLLTAGDLNDQTFRIVILPAELASNPALDVTDYNAVMNLANLGADDIIEIQD